MFDNTREYSIINHKPFTILEKHLTIQDKTIQYSTNLWVSSVTIDYSTNFDNPPPTFDNPREYLTVFDNPLQTFDNPQEYLTIFDNQSQTIDNPLETFDYPL